MAQSGYSVLSLYYSTTASTAPTAGNLVLGELAINTTDGVLYYKDTGGVVQKLATKGGVGTSSTTQVLYNNAGLISGSSNMTFNGTTLTLANDASISGLTVGKGGGSVASNTALGANALLTNSSGTLSVAIGQNTLYNNTSGDQNTAVGRAALYSNTTGNYNAGFGLGALYNNTTASNNTAVGYQAGYSNTTGGNNVSLGFSAGYSVTTNSYNTFVGTYAGYSTTGTANTFIGQNSTVGVGAGYYVTSGSKNTILGGYTGNQGGLDIRTASNYIVLSDGDGNPRIITDASGRTLFGATSFLGSRNAQVGIDINGKDDALFIQNFGSGIGWGITFRPSASASGGNGDCVNFTNTSFTAVGSIKTTSTTTSYNITSDYRLKENVAPMTNALATVSALKPVTYTWKADGSSGQGFIAHELQAVVPDCVSGEKDAVDKDGNPVYQGIDTSFLVATLVSAIQELKAEIDQLKGVK